MADLVDNSIGYIRPTNRPAMDIVAPVWRDALLDQCRVGIGGCPSDAATVGSPVPPPAG
jgi:hypothetical protein